MLDLGIIGRGKTEDYQTKFLSDLVSGEELSGEIYVGEIKKREIGETDSYEFYVTITNHEYKMEWVCKLGTSYYPETDNIYGKKGGRVYIFIDSLNHVLNNTSRNLQDSYSVNFETFRNAVNDNVPLVTVKAIRPLNPNAKYVNLEVISAQCKTETVSRSSTSLDDLADKNPIIRMGYANLKDKKEKVTVKTIAFELKSMLDSGNITELEYKSALKELDGVLKKECK
jgi:hypothetical protein